MVAKVVWDARVNSIYPLEAHGKRSPVTAESIIAHAQPLEPFPLGCCGSREAHCEGRKQSPVVSVNREHPHEAAPALQRPGGRSEAV